MTDSSNFTVDLEALRNTEQALGTTFPAFLWKFYQEETALIAELKRRTKGDDIFLTTDFDWLLTHNRDFLKLPSDSGICRNKICIGTDGCGNDSVISLLGDDERVFFLDHEIASELIDHDQNDFNWEHPEMISYSSLKEYVKEFIELYD